jgi:penicillin-binding protein 1C
MRLRTLVRKQGSLRTTLDRAAQEMAETMLRRQLKEYSGEIAGGAAIVLDTASAAVLARVGGADFFAKRPGSQFDAARARRSPGSALKPFTYALALDRNRLYPSEVLLDGTFDLGSYNPKNFDQRYHGLIPAGAALRQSLYVPAVMVLGRVGAEHLHQFLREAGLSTLRKSAREYGLGLTLGNCEVRLDQLAAAYSLLANLGEYRPLTTLAAARPEARRLLSRGACLSLYEALEQPLPDELDGAALGALSAPPRVAWKTGTSTGNHDAWAFVFNQHYVVGVWLGNLDGRPSRRLVGARAALPLAARIFRQLPPRATPAWPEAGADMQSVEVCSISGLPRSSWCRHTRLARLPQGEYLNRVCDMHWPAGEAPDASAATVVERWPGSAKHWDLARIDAPVVVAAPGAVGRQPRPSDGSVTALQIVNPPHAARFVLTGEAGGDRIRLRSSIDAQQPVHWYCNDRFVATSNPGRPVMLDLTIGHHKLVCMTSEGLTAQVRFQVTEPGAPGAPGGMQNFRGE